MPVDSIQIHGDSRISNEHATLNGRNYHYLLGAPPQGYRETIFLIHGWPDISMGWRYQIPMLLDIGYRVVALDIMGFGGTDAPQVTPGSPTGSPENVQFYGFKRVSDDIAGLARQLGCSHIILGGHDWGAAIVYRVALWYPELITGLFAVCTPYRAPSKQNIDLEKMVKTVLPNFGYQLHLASGEVEKHLKTKEQIKQFLNAVYGGRGPNGEVGFDVRSGPIYENLPILEQSRLMTKEMLDFYGDQYEKNGIHGSLNWYRNRNINFEEELELVKLGRKTLDLPILFVQATKDYALPPSMSEGMEEYCPNMTRKSVETSHWALWEAPEQVNGVIKEFLTSLDKSKSNL